MFAGDDLKMDIGALQDPRGELFNNPGMFLPGDHEAYGRDDGGILWITELSTEDHSIGKNIQDRAWHWKDAGAADAGGGAVNDDVGVRFDHATAALDYFFGFCMHGDHDLDPTLPHQIDVLPHDTVGRHDGGFMLEVENIRLPGDRGIKSRAVGWVGAPVFGFMSQRPESLLQIGGVGRDAASLSLGTV